MREHESILKQKANKENNMGDKFSAVLKLVKTDFKGINRVLTDTHDSVEDLLINKVCSRFLVLQGNDGKIAD